MKLSILDKEAKEVGKQELPSQFNEEVRPDLIKRAVLAIQSHKRQPYGSKPTAGRRQKAKLSRRRHDYKTAYGIGIGRVPRKIMSHSGTRFNWVGAEAPGTVGGRRAHPPKAEKILDQKINKKERKKAIRSAIAATIKRDLVEKRGHVPPKTYPFILDDKIETLSKTKEVIQLFEKIGLTNELGRTNKTKIRSGKSKMRGRKYQKTKSLLLVVGSDCNLLKSVSNIPGVDIVDVKNLNAELLAPGADIARLTIFTKKAIETLEKNKLFI